MHVQTELKRKSCGSEVAKKGISCYFYDASCIWNVRGTCCGGKEDCCHASVNGLEGFLYFWKLSRSDRIRGIGRLPCMNASLVQGFSCVANNLLHVSHLKGFIFRWTLCTWEWRSSDMVNFLSHCEHGKRGPSSSLWCCFLWRFLFCTYDFRHSGQRCRSTGTYFCGYNRVFRGMTL